MKLPAYVAGFVVLLTAVSAHADFELKCKGELSNSTWKLDAGDFSVEAPKTAYKRNANQRGQMRENCRMQKVFNARLSFSTAGCYTLSTSLTLSDREIADAIYKKDNVRGGNAARAVLSKLARENTSFGALLSTFDLAEEDVSIDDVSFEEQVRCTIAE